MAVNSICWPLPSKFSFFSFKYKRKIQVQPLLLEFRRLLPSCLVAMDGVSIDLKTLLSFKIDVRHAVSKVFNRKSNL